MERDCKNTASFILASSGIKTRDEILRMVGNLSAIAAERALSKDWTEHPMFGINSKECKDKWAVSYQKELKRLNRFLGA